MQRPRSEWWARESLITTAKRQLSQDLPIPVPSSAALATSLAFALYSFIDAQPAYARSATGTGQILDRPRISQRCRSRHAVDLYTVVTTGLRSSRCVYLNLLPVLKRSKKS